MSDRPVWCPFLPRSGYIGAALLLSLNVSVGHGATPEMQRIAAGAEHSLGIKSDGSLWAWGANGVGQLGDGTTVDRISPVPIVAGVTALAAGAFHSLALKTDGTLWAWGENWTGQLGDGSSLNRTSPVYVLSGVSDIAAAGDAIYGHSLALKTDGSLWAWGYNADSQLGDGTTATRKTPIQVMNDVAAMEAGGFYIWFHTFAIKTDGSLWAWGYNRNGQLGDGTTTSRRNPVQVLTGVAAISTGASHTLALKTDGSLWAWGYNAYGELGDGTTTNRLLPVQVLTGVAAVSTGAYHTMAVKTDGSLWAWGYNAYGQLGDGTTTNRSTPVQVLTGVAGVAGGNYFTLARKTDGSLWAWGRNNYGQLGDGTFVDRLLRVQVAGFPPMPPQLDFVVTNVVLTPSSPTAGETFSAAVTVTNQGTAAGVPGTLQVWANQPIAQACGAVGNKSATLGSLAAGASQTVTLSGLEGTAGTNTLRTFIDSQCQVAELSETNNQLTKSYTIFLDP